MLRVFDFVVRLSDERYNILRLFQRNNSIVNEVEQKKRKTNICYRKILKNILWTKQLLRNYQYFVTPKINRFLKIVLYENNFRKFR